jgi:hypothetical protein
VRGGGAEMGAYAWNNEMRPMARKRRDMYDMVGMRGGGSYLHEGVRRERSSGIGSRTWVFLATDIISVYNLLRFMVFLVS